MIFAYIIVNELAASYTGVHYESWLHQPHERGHLAPWSPWLQKDIPGHTAPGEHTGKALAISTADIKN